jgi:hypothetical protein
MVLFIIDELSAALRERMPASWTELCVDLAQGGFSIVVRNNAVAYTSSGGLGSFDDAVENDVLFGTLGLDFVGRLVDALTFSREHDGRNRFSLVKKFPGSLSAAS